MRISSMLFFCIKNTMDIVAFPRISWYKVTGKRQWENYSAKKKARICKKMSISAETSLKNIKKKKLMSKGMKKYWKNLSKKEKDTNISMMSKGMKKAWDESDETFKPRLGPVATFKKRINIKRDVPRINTYSGVITESEMEEINV